MTYKILAHSKDSINGEQFYQQSQNQNSFFLAYKVSFLLFFGLNYKLVLNIGLDILFHQSSALEVANWGKNLASRPSSVIFQLSEFSYVVNLPGLGFLRGIRDDALFLRTPLPHPLSDIAVCGLLITHLSTISPHFAQLAPYLTMALVKTDTVYVPGVLESRTIKAPSLPWNG